MRRGHVGSRLHQWCGLAAIVAVALTGCSSSGSDGASDTDTSAAGTSSSPSDVDAGTELGGISGEDLQGSLTVYAASSLKVSFDKLRDQFQDDHPGLGFPEISYNGSSTLATQIEGGAPADVFASANETQMDKVGNLVTDRANFATNSLQIAVAPGNPKNITSLADIAQPEVLTVICAAEVPCGSAAHKALDAAGVQLTPASEEQNVTAVRTKVASDEADAGLIYATDVNSSDGKVDGIDFPEAADAVNTYPIAVLMDSSNTSAAKAFIGMVTGPAGQQVLESVGFGAP